MTFENFDKQVEVLSKAESTILRELYIKQFIDTSISSYKNDIANMKLFSDGYCYTGYLWDCLLQHSKITMKSLLEELVNKEKILILWDIHSCDRIFIENYWRFPKVKVIRVDAKYLIEGIEYLPEDIYIFDYDFSWTYIITHEDDGKRRICLKII